MKGGIIYDVPFRRRVRMVYTEADVKNAKASGFQSGALVAGAVCSIVAFFIWP